MRPKVLKVSFQMNDCLGIRKNTLDPDEAADLARCLRPVRRCCLETRWVLLFFWVRRCGVWVWGEVYGGGGGRGSVLCP